MDCFTDFVCFPQMILLKEKDDGTGDTAAQQQRQEGYQG